MQQRNKVLCVIVLYNTVITESIAYSSLVQAGIDIFIVDNSPTYAAYQDITYKNVVKYLHCPNNPGVSFAYNKAAIFATEQGYEWMLISDQDTYIPSDIIAEFNKCIQQYPSIKLFCPKVFINNNRILSPVKSKYYLSKPSKNAPDGIIDLKNYSIINSGIIVNLEAFHEVGGYNEMVNLDFSDIQFIERFGAVYSNACVLDSSCIQSYSNEVQSQKQKLNRFKLFCQSLKHYEPIVYTNRLWLWIVVMKRTVSLCLQCRSLTPICIMFNNYLR